MSQKTSTSQSQYVSQIEKCSFINHQPYQIMWSINSFLPFLSLKCLIRFSSWGILFGFLRFFFTYSSPSPWTLKLTITQKNKSRYFLGKFTVGHELWPIWIRSVQICHNSTKIKGNCRSSAPFIITVHDLNPICMSYHINHIELKNANHRSNNEDNYKRECNSYQSQHEFQQLFPRSRYSMLHMVRGIYY